MEGILGPSTRAGPGTCHRRSRRRLVVRHVWFTWSRGGGVAHHRGIGVRGAVADHAGGSAAGTDALAVSPHGLGMTSAGTRHRPREPSVAAEVARQDVHDELPQDRETSNLTVAPTT